MTQAATTTKNRSVCARVPHERTIAFAYCRAERCCARSLPQRRYASDKATTTADIPRCLVGGIDEGWLVGWHGQEGGRSTAPRCTSAILSPSAALLFLANGTTTDQQHQRDSTQQRREGEMPTAPEQRRWPKRERCGRTWRARCGDGTRLPHQGRVVQPRRQPAVDGAISPARSLSAKRAGGIWPHSRPKGSVLRAG